MPGYCGWQWAVVVAAHPGADHATISEVVLVPGPTALLAPRWVPWEERVRPGDLGPGDLLAPPRDDPRLVPGYTATGDPAVDDVAVELGFGRRQVLSEVGPGRRRAALARRRLRSAVRDGAIGSAGHAATARSTFRWPASLGTMFGVCANEMSADGHVVDAEYGCGAHSDTPAPAGSGSPRYDPFDDGVLDLVEPSEN